MKKKTKKKANNFGIKIFRFLLKLILVYPFKGLWFVTKHSYLVVHDAIKEARKKRKQSKAEKEIKELKEQARKTSEEKSKTKEDVDKRKEIVSQGTSSNKEVLEYDSLKELKNKKGELSFFVDKLYDNKSMIGIILGARGTGKSAIGMKLLENFMVKTNKKIYALGFKQTAVPRWIKVISNIEEIENDAVILIDEAGIEFSSRKAMSGANKLLSELLLIARHKDLSVMFIAQNSSNLEINVIRQADFLILKPSSLLQKDFERKKIQKIYESVEKDFEELSEDKGLTYVFADKYCGFVSNSLPSFWSEKVSKGYANK